VLTQDSALLERCLSAVANDPELHDLDVIAYALLAMDRGVDASPLLDRWKKPEAVDDQDIAHMWRAAEVRRLARVELDAALTLEEALPRNWSNDREASMAVAARLARVDPETAFERAVALGADYDHVGWFEGCIAAKIPRAGTLIDAWIRELGPYTYDAYFYATAILEACIELGDQARARACLETGGFTGWQVAHAARWALARAPEPVRFLDVLLDRYDPGCVSGRAYEPRGLNLGRGKGVMHPEWLDFFDPHPVETLSIIASLGERNPLWFADWLP